MRKSIVYGLFLALLIVMSGCVAKEKVEEEVVEIPVIEGAEEVVDFKYTLPNSQIEGIFTGLMKDGIPIETGSYQYLDTYETVYVGTWEKGLPNGLGTYTWKDGDKYVGEIENGRLNGFGKYIYKSGIEHEGKFANGVLVPDKTYKVGEQARVGEYLVTVQNVIHAKVDESTMMQVQLLIENKFVDKMNTAHFLSFEIYDGVEKVGYSDISTTANLYEPFFIDDKVELTAIFKDINEDGTYQLLYDFDTLGTGVAIFDLSE